MVEVELKVENKLSKDLELALELLRPQLILFKLPRIPNVPIASDLISEVMDEATWRLSRLLFPFPPPDFLPVELFEAEVLEAEDPEAAEEGTAGEAPEDVSEVAPTTPEATPAPDNETTLAPVEVAPVKLFLICSKLLLEPADMSLAGPVAEVREIFSGSNSAGPVNSIKIEVKNLNFIDNKLFNL